MPLVTSTHQDEWESKDENGQEGYSKFGLHGGGRGGEIVKIVKGNGRWRGGRMTRLG
jgi:hypothetical protein